MVDEYKEIILKGLLENEIIDVDLYEKCSKPHITSLPYDLRTNDLDKLNERLNVINDKLEELDKSKTSQNNNYFKLSDDLGDDYEDVLEDILRDNGILSDEGMVYESINIGNIPTFSKDDEIRLIQDNAILIEDNTYYYVLMDNTTLLQLEGRSLTPQQIELGKIDYSVQKLLKRKYPYLDGIMGDDDSQKIRNDYVEEMSRTQEKINQIKNG